MAEAFAAFFTNRILLGVFFSYLLASILKVLVSFLRTRKLNFLLFFRTGGMPSSHAAVSSSMAASVYFSEGMSNLFFVSLVIGAVIVSDAVVIRRAAGKQAEILNKIVEEFQTTSKFKAERLYELLGHTPFQAIVGIIIGILVSMFFFFMY